MSEPPTLYAAYNEIRNLTRVELYLHFAADKSTSNDSCLSIMLSSDLEGPPYKRKTPFDAAWETCMVNLELELEGGKTATGYGVLHWLADGQRFSTEAFIKIDQLRLLTESRSVLFQLGNDEHEYTLNLTDKTRIMQFCRYFDPPSKSDSANDSRR